ncbi:MAG: hypothetical protein K1X94_17400 [Sandaracinaceae bacterium]|nr:hypothetical protein [Sandaracinaceae bacterium]
MRHLSVLLACLLLCPLTLAATASAQDHDRRGERASEVEVMDFLDGDRVEGDLVGPLGDLVRGAHGHGHHSLIRPRAHFQLEILKSVENL